MPTLAGPLQTHFVECGLYQSILWLQLYKIILCSTQRFLYTNIYKTILYWLQNTLWLSPITFCSVWENILQTNNYMVKYSIVGAAKWFMLA